MIRAGMRMRGGDAAGRDGARARARASGLGACGYRTFDVAEGRVRRDQAHVAQVLQRRHVVLLLALSNEERDQSSERGV